VKFSIIIIVIISISLAFSVHFFLLNSGFIF
jgi:hypothetical protein